MRLLCLLPFLVLAACKGPKNQATAIIQCHPSVLQVPMDDEGNLDFNTGYMENAVGSVTSDQVLQPVAEELKIDLTRLKKMVSLEARRGTDFYSLTADHYNRATSVRIANSVAHSYINERKTAAQERAKQALDAMNARLKEAKGEKLEELRMKLEKLQIRLNGFQNPVTLHEAAQ